MANDGLTFTGDALVTAARYSPGKLLFQSGGSMSPFSVTFAATHDRRAYDAAAELIESFGQHAGFEAAARAERSRGLGNHIHFCRWREVERVIAALSQTDAVGSIH